MIKSSQENVYFRYSSLPAPLKQYRIKLRSDDSYPIMVLGDLFYVRQFKRHPFIKDSSEVVVTMVSESSCSTG